MSEPESDSDQAEGQQRMKRTQIDQVALLSRQQVACTPATIVFRHLNETVTHRTESVLSFSPTGAQKNWGTKYGTQSAS